MNTTPAPVRPLSVRIGRIVVRLVLLGAIVYGVKYGWDAHIRKQRAEEIAPIHAYALSMMVALKNGDYFAAQEKLDPSLHHRVGIDWLASFAERAELNATRNGTWNDWNRTREANATLYRMSGQLVYTNAKTHPMYWEIRKSNNKLHVRDLIIDQHSIRPKAESRFQ